MSTDARRRHHGMVPGEPADEGLPVTWVIAVVLVVLAAVTALGAIAA